MKTIATLYELLPDEMAAFQSEDGFTLKIEGGPQVILRAPQNGASAQVEPDRSVSSRVARARSDGKYLCKHGCGESFDNRFQASAHSRYKHPKGENGSAAPETDGKKVFCPMKNCGESFKGKVWRDNHLRKVHNVDPPPS